MTTNGCVYRCLGLVFSVLGIIVVVLGFQQLYYGSKSNFWPRVNGVVRQAKVKSGSKGSSRPLIRYDYIVDGSQYTGEKYRYGGINSNHSTKKIVAQHPVGSDVKVYYDPNSPEKSVLVPGRGWGSYFVVGLAMLFFLIGLVCLLPDGARNEDGTGSPFEPRDSV